MCSERLFLAAAVGVASLDDVAPLAFRPWRLPPAATLGGTFLLTSAETLGLQTSSNCLSSTAAN